MDPSETDKEKIEKAVLDIIIDDLRAGRMTVEAAKEIARLTLEEVPLIDSNEKILNLFSRLTSTHKSFEELYIKEKSDSIKRKEVFVWQTALELIHQGKLDEAQELVNKAVVMEEPKVA